MPATVPVQFIARFEDKIIHNEKFVEYHFEMETPHRLEFTAGQYVSVKVAETGERRSYSLCSAPSIDHGFELLLDISPGGLGTQRFESLQYGARLEGIGPLGNFVISSQPESAIALVATGSGIAPLKSMLLDLVEKRDPRPITLYWGMRKAEHLFWLDEIQDIVEATSNVSFYPVISQPNDEWTLSTGHVTDILSVHQFPQDAGYYVCGSEEITQSIRQFLLEKLIAPGYIHHEAFV